MSCFIDKHISGGLIRFVKNLLLEEDGYFLKLDDPIYVGKGKWKVIGLDKNGYPSMGHDITITYSSFTGSQMLDLKFSIDNGEYKVFKY